MLSKPFVLLLVFLTVFSAVLPSHAASFDCSKVKAPDEVAVCGHQDLSELDTEMGALWFAYRRIPFLMGASGARMDDANQFLQDRTACGANVVCLRRIYQARVKALKNDLTNALAAVSKEENADQPTPSELPSPVKKIIAGYADQCRRLGGALTAGLNNPEIMTADLDGDGKVDYVVNPQNLQCSAAATAFCGNGGCQIEIAVSGNGYQKPIEVLGGQPTISQTQDNTRVAVWVDGLNCKISDRAEACWAIYSWNDHKVSQRYQAKPQVCQ